MAKKRARLPVIDYPEFVLVPVYNKDGVSAYARVSPGKRHLVEGRNFYQNHHGYVVTHGKKGEPANVQLARLVMGAPVGMEVDHIGHDRLDNRDENLRLCTHAQNMMNHPGRLGRGRGVRKMKGWSWQARIMVSRVAHHLGSFATQEEAITARRLAEIRLRGRFAPGVKT